MRRPADEQAADRDDDDAAASSTISAIVRPAITEPREIGSVRRRSIRPLRMSEATPTAMPGRVPIIDWAKMPETR